MYSEMGTEIATIDLFLKHKPTLQENTRIRIKIKLAVKNKERKGRREEGKDKDSD